MVAGKCPNCDGPNESGLCPVLDEFGLRARCVGQWYAEKLFFMRRYADIFTKGMKNKWAHLAYLDLFAGPGRCRVKPRGQFDEGSPMIALELGFTHYYFSDLSQEVTQALEARTRRLARPDQFVRVQTGDANVLTTGLNAEVRSLGRETLSFAFIDPPGTEMRYDALGALTAGLSMDLLVFFPLYMNIQRQAHYRHADPVDDAQWDAYYGTDAWRAARNARQRYELYRSQLRKLGYGYFGASKLIRDRQGRKLYILIAASKHKRGEEFWNKVTHEDAARQIDLFRPLK